MKKASDFLKQCEYFVVSSINGDFPASRPFGSVMEHENNLYISTDKSKEICKQLKANNHIQITALKNGTRKWIRITGISCEFTDLKIKKKMLEKSPDIAKHFTAENDENFILFQIKPIQIEFKEGDKTLWKEKSLINS